MKSNPSLTSMLKALILGGALSTAASPKADAAAIPDTDATSLSLRIQRAQEQLNRQQQNTTYSPGAAGAASPDTLWWRNWGNWHNGGWPNWRNGWHNWGNGGWHNWHNWHNW